jgi:hypothetical protein
MAYALYHHGVGYPEGYLFNFNVVPPLSEKGLWKHAEDYLERLDAVASNGGRLRQKIQDFRSLLRGQPSLALVHAMFEQLEVNADHKRTENLFREAQRIVAAECSLFARSVSCSSERAKPYTSWLARLSRGRYRDSIITFNYDRLLEQLGQEAGTPVIVAGMPGAELTCVEHSADAKKNPILIKLHGSVDWQRRHPSDSTAFPFIQGLVDQAVRNPEGQIAVPGNSKGAASTGELAPLWQLARKKLTEADEVVFVGYRMPQSDATAREMILDALDSNRVKLLRARIVLGPANFDRDRLVTLLRLSMPFRHDHHDSSLGPRLKVDVVDAWAEDYLQARRD